jgi:DNA-directed RNA polymerase specialized sigma24 family protein
LDHFPADETSPDLAAMVADECRHLLSQLDPELQDLALAKMEGHSNEQIAQHTGRSVRTIERRLQLIRRKWEEGPVP